VKTDEMSPSALWFRVRGTASLAIDRLDKGVAARPGQTPARNLGHLPHAELMARFILDSAGYHWTLQELRKNSELECEDGAVG
jgi:hypothetical protein